MDYGLIDGVGMVGIVQKNAKKVQKNAISIAYIKKKQYLCSGFQ